MSCIKDMRSVYSIVRVIPPTTEEKFPVIIHTTTDTWDAVSGVHAILDQLYRTDLGNELSRHEFETIGQIKKVLASMLADHGVEVD